MRHARWVLVLFVCLGAAVPAASAGSPALGKPQQADVAAMLVGVEEIALPGVPGTLSVFGPKAFPVIAGTSGGRPAPLVGATRHGRGRAVLFGHGYFEAALKVGDTEKLVRNVAVWVAGKARSKIGVRKWKAVRASLAAQGHEVIALDDAAWTKQLSSLDAVFVPLADITEAELAVLAKRLKGGLGVVAGMPGWGWQQLNPKRLLSDDNHGNRLLGPAGLVWGGEYLTKPKSGTLRVKGPAPALSHAGIALDALVAEDEGGPRLAPADGALAVATVTRAIREVPTDDKLLLSRLGKLLKHAADPRYLPSAARPLGDTDGLGKLLLTMQVQRDALLEPARIRAHAASEAFPGSVAKSARRVRRKVMIDTAIPGWHSTGLYAPPGGLVSAVIERRAIADGLALRIGAHKDRLWGKGAWSRVPEITVERPLDATSSEHACAFGGLVYVVVPPGCTLGSLRVALGGVVEAPHFKLGMTTTEEWLARQRSNPGPWAELETSKVIITVPSATIRALDDPEALMIWWDRVMDGCADLSARPHERVRPERYVADVQISNGYMHAGYPIMTHLDAAPRFVDLPTLKTKGDWGMFHEMGHNHQHKDWTFAGTVEVTCNLYSLYLMETVCEKGIGHVAMSPASIAKNTQAYEKGERKFGLWKAKPFTALIMYQQLRTAFGWDAYKRTFATYRDLADYERPKNDAEKRDQWMVRMAKTVGRDLGPFFERWGIPVSKKARAAIASLPPWQPDDGR